LLNSLTANAIAKAHAVAFEVDGFDEVTRPTTVRLTRGTLTFYDALAKELGISRNALVEMVLGQLMSSVSSPSSM